MLDTTRISNISVCNNQLIVKSAGVSYFFDLTKTVKGGVEVIHTNPKKSSKYKKIDYSKIGY